MNRANHRDDAGAKLGMWLFLFTELLLFGGLFILYAVYLSRYPVEFSTAGAELDTVLGTVNTVVLLTSSMFAAMAVTALQRGSRPLAEALLAGTILCGTLFMVNKYVEWHAKIDHGIFPGSATLAGGESVFFSLYYITTGLHGLHVLAGTALLAWVWAGVRSGACAQGNYSLLENGALYWHLVDLVWIFIFPLYYLIL